MAISRLVMRNKLSFLHYLIGIIALAGVVLTLIPYFKQTGLLYHTSAHVVTNQTSNESLHTTNVSETSAYSHIQPLFISVSLIAFAALNGGAEGICISNSTLKDEDPIKVAFYFTTACAVVSFILMLAFESPLIPKSPDDKISLLIHSLSASSVTYVTIIAYQNVNPNSVVIIMSLRVPLALLSQTIFLHKGSHLTAEFIRGITLVFMSAISMPLYEYYISKGEPSLS